MSSIAATDNSLCLTGNMQCSYAIFAQELVDMIVDFLYDDRATLAACGLTCRSWLPAARFHLFYRVEVSPFTFQSLCEVFERWPHLAVHVQSLSVGDRALSDQKTPPADEMVAQVHRLTALLTSVRYLRISGRFLRWTARRAWPVLRALSSSMSQVTHLDVLYLTVLALGDWAVFLSNFTALRRVSLFQVFWGVGDGPDPALRLAHPLTMEIYIHRPQLARPFYDWIARQQPVPELHGFLLHVEYEGGLLTRALLQSPLAASIRVLYLRYDMIAGGADALARGIGHCTRLRELRFASPIFPEVFKPRQNAIANIISSIRSEYLVVVSFALICEHPETAPLDADTLQGLANALRTPALGGLCRAEVILLTSEDSGDYPDLEPLREQWAALGAPVPLSFRSTQIVLYNFGFPW
ncbi:hypothetical protein HWV62_8805 [Athelia sp. TMB]|nr:hypothetical protein HWV62_8805 [Athelia sp. TMB]